VTLNEAESLIEKAAAAQKEWQHVPLQQRIELCERFLDILEQRRLEIAADITGQMGKPLQQALNELNGVKERTVAMCALAPSMLAMEENPGNEPPDAGFYKAIVREPVGVVLVVAPWNYLLLTSVNHVVPAILSGNAVAMKHASRTPLCANHFVDAFAAAGAPEGLVVSIPGDHSTINTIMGHPKVNYVAFTGSVEGGRRIYQTAATHLIEACTELGGKDPAYVAEDADPATAAAALIDGAFYNAGQSCCAIERVYVHESKYADFLEAATAEVAALAGKMGDPMAESTGLGPLANDDRDFLHTQVQQAVDKGARVLFDSKEHLPSSGRFFSPTLLADCTHDMDLMTVESFGPVLGVTKVADDDVAIQMFNDSPYGLSAAVYTDDVDRAHRFGREVETGTLFMNRCDYLDPYLPWTGVKDTGKGVSLSRHAFSLCTRLKSIHFRLPN
jgi:acyl-CoA reductase-like NAD-dependent aldehyde dehydrogenase